MKINQKPTRQIERNIKMKTTHTLLIAILTIASLAGCSQNPQKGTGGVSTFYQNLGAEPSTLNPITSTDVYSLIIRGYIVDSLMTRNKDTYKWEPSLATSVTTSKDGKIFTVKIRKGVTFSDGKPLTAQDVKFSFDVYFDDTYNAVHVRTYLEGIKKVEVVDPYTIRFHAKETYFGNYNIVAGLNIIPKHIYEDAKVGRKKNKTVIGSGPYILHKYDQGKRLILKRNPNWWGYKDLKEKAEKRYNFDTLAFRFIKENQVAIETMKKGSLDFLGLTPEDYVKKTSGPLWKTKLVKKKTKNQAPKGYGYIGWNLKNDLFKDRRVRRALNHLVNREMMNKKFRFNMSKLATGPWYRDSIYADPTVKPILFSPKKAQALLKAAGWRDSDKNSILEKKNKKGKKQEFSFTLMFANKDSEKYWTLFKEDLKKNGIQMNLKFIEWNSFIQLLDEKKFEAVVLGWGGGSVDLDPKQIWHSSSANKGGSNFISYKNKKVDKLIEKARLQLNRDDRVKTLRKVYSLIANDAPYAFLFNSKFVLYAKQSRIQQKKDSYNYTLGEDYWWLQRE